MIRLRIAWHYAWLWFFWTPFALLCNVFILIDWLWHDWIHPFASDRVESHYDKLDRHTAALRRLQGRKG